MAIDCLLSPKEEIDVTGIRGLSWGKILRAAQNGVLLPPIEITPGIRGVRIANVLVKDELDELRKATQ